MKPEAWIRAVYGGQFPRNSWFELPHLSVYMRVIPNLKQIDIANVTARSQGAGHFTVFLVHMESLAQELGATLRIENVLEPRFQSFFARRGYTSDNQPTPSFRRPA